MMASVAGLTESASPAAISTIETTIRPQYDESRPVVEATRKPVVMVSSPPVTMTLVPTLRISTMARGDTPAVTIANGNVATPARSVE